MILEPPKIKSDTVSTVSPSISREVMGPDAIMAFGPITSLQIEGDKMETVTDFIFLGSKITTDGDCNHEMKRYLFLGRKAMTNLDSILKNRDITLPIKV